MAGAGVLVNAMEPGTPILKDGEPQDMECSAWISVSRRGNEQKTQLEFRLRLDAT
jgi:hypothetical protein